MGAMLAAGTATTLLVFTPCILFHFTRNARAEGCAGAALAKPWSRTGMNLMACSMHAFCAGWAE